VAAEQGGKAMRVGRGSEWFPRLDIYMHR